MLYLPFLDSYWVRVVVRRHRRLRTLSMTVKPQAVRSVVTYPEYFILQINVHMHYQRSQSWFKSVQLVDYLFIFYKYFIWQCMYIFGLWHSVKSANLKYALDMIQFARRNVLTRQLERNSTCSVLGLETVS